MSMVRVIYKKTQVHSRTAQSQNESPRMPTQRNKTTTTHEHSFEYWKLKMILRFHFLKFFSAEG